MTDIYRQAASLIVLRPTSVCLPGGECKDVHQLLLLHKPRKKDAWQLPQGGVEEGENTEQAALRELKEEAGISSAKVIGKSGRVYQYDFPPSFRRFRPDNVKGQRIEYIFTLVPADTSVQVDQQEIDGFLWVDPADLKRYIRRKEYLSLTEDLYREALACVQ